MRFWAVFIKSVYEQWRAPLVLFLTLIFAPLIIYLYLSSFPGKARQLQHSDPESRQRRPRLMVCPSMPSTALRMH